MKREEFATLSQAIRQRIVDTARRITGNSDDAEDIAQETLLRMWELRDHISEFRSPEAMAVAIARNMSIDLIRSSGRMTDISPETIDLHDISPHDKMILAETSAEIDRILSRIPASQQTILKLRHIESLSVKEIAGMLATSEGNVRTLLCRARNNIRKQFRIQPI